MGIFKICIFSKKHGKKRYNRFSIRQSPEQKKLVISWTVELRRRFPVVRL